MKRKIIYVVLFVLLQSVFCQENIKIEEAEMLFASGNYQKALSLLSEVIEEEPDNTLAYMDRVAILISLNRNKEALPEVNAIIEKEPGNMKAYHFRASINESLGNYEEAIQDESILLSYFSTYVPALNLRGFAYIETGMLDEAVNDLSKAINLSNRTDEDLNIFYLNRAFAYYTLKNYQYALNDINQSIQLFNFNLDAHVLKTQILWRMKKYSEALAVISKQINKFEQKYDLYYFRIMINLEKEDLKSVKKDLDYIEKHVSSSSDFHYLKAAYCLCIGKETLYKKELKLAEQYSGNTEKSFIKKAINSELKDFIIKS